MKLGTARYGGQKKQYFKLKEGASSFRILPPLGDLADEGIWSMYYRVHYGYTNAAGKSRPFESSLVKNNKTKMIEVPDAAVERLDKLKAKLEEAQKAGNKKVSEELLKLVGGQKSRYNLDNNHYMNVVDSQGNIGILKLRHTAKKALDLVIRELRDKNIDPLSVDNGRFFTFTRTGMGRETSFAVKVTTRTITVADVGEVEQAIVHKLDESIIVRLKNEAAELQKLFKKPTAEQVAQIVAESNLATGVSPNIDEILGYQTQEAAGDGDDTTGAEDTASTEQAAVIAANEAATKVETKTEPKVSPIVETKVVTTEVETKKTTVTPATVAPTTAQKVADMSDDEFLNSLGLK